MSATVVVLSEFAAKRRLASADGDAAASRCGTVSEYTPGVIDFCFWQGADGNRYVHHVYTLIDCPPLPAANYILVATDKAGNRSVLRIGRTTHTAATLNLAEIRHRGAKLGATEVHVHLIAGTDQQRRIIEKNVRAAVAVNSNARPMTA
jgi:ribosomal protein S28E/S33